MTAKKSFLIVLRIIFVLFSLQFVNDAFYKWDGYSYYMQFKDFLPDLSLAFILWTIIIAILACALWVIVYAFFTIIPKSIIPVRLEHILFFLIFIALPFFIKRTFYSKFSISGLIGLSRPTILTIGFILLVVIVWFGRKHIGKIIDKVLYGLYSRITPLVWLFVFLFIFSIPISVFKDLKSSHPSFNKVEQRKITGERTSNLNQPNIILIVMDSLTSLDMQLYGYERPTTPFISEWAKDAIVFNRAYASSNYTTPTTMSLLTGQRVWTHKIWYAAYNHPVGNYENNLPSVLNDNGYTVYGLVQNDNAHPIVLGIQNAFFVKDNVRTFQIPKWWYSKFKDFFFPDRPIANRWIFSDSFVTQWIHHYAPEVKATLKPPTMVYSKFLEYISRKEVMQSKRPFFAYLHVMPPHYDYLPPKHYMGLFRDAEKFNSDEKQWSNFNFNGKYNPERQTDVDILRKRYDEFILYSDKEFERFMSLLAEKIDMSNTIVILTSDHGESFSHDWLAHTGPHLYEPLVHVPLIIKLPDKKFGKRIDMPVEQIDIAPTILELVGIAPPKWMEGQSLKPLIELKKVEPHPIFSMHLQKNRSFGHLITKGTIAVWDGDYKLIYYLKDDKKLLFNLENDPQERENIFEKETEIGGRLLSLINTNLSNANSRIRKSSLTTSDP